MKRLLGRASLPGLAAASADARPTLGGFTGATSVSNMPGNEDAAGATTCGALRVDGERFTLPLTISVPASTTVAGVSSGDFFNATSNPVNITTNFLIPNDFNSYESQLFVSTEIAVGQAENLAGLMQWVIVESISNVEQSQQSLSKYGLTVNAQGAVTQGAASSTAIISPEGVPMRRTFNPTVQYSLSLVPSQSIVIVAPITFCLVLYGTRGGRGVGPFTSMAG